MWLTIKPLWHGWKNNFTRTVQVRKVVPNRKRKPSNIIRAPLYSIIYIKYETFLLTPVTQYIEIPRRITCVSHASVCTFLRVRSSCKTYSICITVWLLFVFKMYTFYMHGILNYTFKKKMFAFRKSKLYTYKKIVYLQLLPYLFVKRQKLFSIIMRRSSSRYGSSVKY